MTPDQTVLEGVRVAVDPDTFKAALGQWPSGVTIVTTLTDGAWHGMTASSFSSVSADPPLVSVCLLKGLFSHDLIAKSGVFGINILAADQTELGKRFAGMRPDVADRFDGLDVETAETGVPLFSQSLAWLDCKVLHAYEGGDHTIFVGEVQAARNPRKSAPLLYHSRSWGQFADQLPETASVTDSGLRRAFASVDLDATAIEQALTDAGVEVRDADIAVTPGDAASLDAARGKTDAGRVLLLNAFSEADHDVVLETAEALAEAGFKTVVLDDTGADANPLTLRNRIVDVAARVRPAAEVGVRLRDHAGLGSANALAALKSGVKLFDTTLGGIDGTFATEDALYLIALLNVGTAADRAKVVTATRTLANTWATPLPSRTHDIDIAQPTLAAGGNA